MGRVGWILDMMENDTGWMDTGQDGIWDGLDEYWIGWNMGWVGWILNRMEYGTGWMDSGQDGIWDGFE